jgi:hypothetical protein
MESGGDNGRSQDTGRAAGGKRGRVPVNGTINSGTGNGGRRGFINSSLDAMINSATMWATQEEDEGYTRGWQRPPYNNYQRQELSSSLAFTLRILIIAPSPGLSSTDVKMI